MKRKTKRLHMIKNAYKIVSHSAEKSDARINAER